MVCMAVNAHTYIYIYAHNGMMYHMVQTYMVKNLINRSDIGWDDAQVYHTPLYNTLATADH